MPASLFIPQPGFRFIFSNQEDYVFEITTVAYGTIRYAAVIGGKSFTLSSESFEQYYKNDEIKCIFAPEKLIIDPEKCSEIQRKERYVKSALYKLHMPTALVPLKELIKEVAAELGDQTPPSPRTVARWVNKYHSTSHNNLSLSNGHKGNQSLRFPPEIYQIMSQGINEVYLKPEYRTSKDVQAYVLGRLIEQGISTKYLPSRRTIQRYIEKLDPYLITKIKKGSRIARKTFQASGQSCPSPFALYMVEIDSPELDSSLLGMQIFAATKGYHSYVMSLIRESIVIALEDGRSTVTQNDFSQAWKLGITLFISDFKQDPFVMSLAQLASGIKGV